MNPVNYNQKRGYAKKKSNKLNNLDKNLEELLNILPKDIKFEDISADEVFSDPSTKNLNDLDKATKIYNTYLKAKRKNEKEYDKLEDMDGEDIQFEDILKNFGGVGLGRQGKKSKKTSISKLMNELNEIKDSEINEELEDIISDPQNLENPLFSPFELVSKDEPIPNDQPAYIKLHNKEHEDEFAYLKDINTNEDAQKYCSEEENYGNLLLANNFSSMATYFYIVCLLFLLMEMVILLSIYFCRKLVL